MLKTLIQCACLGALVLISGCNDAVPSTSGQSTAPALTASAAPAPAPVAVPVKHHFYDFNDGVEYGYSTAISNNQQQAGQAASHVVMVKFAGVRDGKYQVHLTDGNQVTALECANPCEVTKVMSFIDADYLRDKVNIQRYRFDPDSVGSMALTDAMNGELHQYGIERDGKRYQVWVEEKRGYRTYALSVAK